MNPERAEDARAERYLSPAAVAGRFLTRLENISAWVAEGRLQAVETPRGLRIPESSVLQFQREAYRRETYNGIDHGLHSWPDHKDDRSALPVPIQDANEGLSSAPRWPFPNGQGWPPAPNTGGA